MEKVPLSVQCLFKNAECPATCALYPDNPEAIPVDKAYSDPTGILHVVSPEGVDTRTQTVNPASLWQYCELAPKFL